MKNIKIRIWEKSSQKMYYPDKYILSWAWFGITDDYYIDDSNSKDYPIDQSHYEMTFHTGWCDKSGRELFQGDYFQYQKHKGHNKDNFIGEVIWLEEQGAWGYRTLGYDYAFNDADEIASDILEHIIIIGNVFENPEIKTI